VADVFVTKTLAYVTDGATQVTVTIVIGESQVGESDGRLAGKGTASLETDGDHEIITARANPGLNLKGMVLTCQTRVKDINPDSNRTSVTHTVEGGPEEQTNTFPSIADTNGRVIYNISYVFV